MPILNFVDTSYSVVVCERVVNFDMSASKTKFEVYTLIVLFKYSFSPPLFFHYLLITPSPDLIFFNSCLSICILSAEHINTVFICVYLNNFFHIITPMIFILYFVFPLDIILLPG